jgi:hypothetical protein
MAYVPPNRRKLQTEKQRREDAIQTMNKSPEKHFPSLSNNVPLVAREVLSYKEKSKEWEDKRIESEKNERIDARMAEIREQYKRREEYDRSMTMHAIINRYEESREMPAAPEPEPAPLPVIRNDDEWTTVKRKQRKPRKDFYRDDDGFDADLGSGTVGNDDDFSD